MGLLIILAGFIISSILVATLRTSQTRTARTLLREVALWPAKEAPRLQHRTAAVRLGLLFGALWLLAIALFMLSDKWPATSFANSATSFVGLLCFFAGFLFLGLGIREVARSLRASSTQPPSGAA